MKRNRIDNGTHVKKDVGFDFGQPPGFVTEAFRIVDKDGNVVIRIGTRIAAAREPNNTTRSSLPP
jgi:hypothetical protein